jgi:hypothetical protein
MASASCATVIRGNSFTQLNQLSQIRTASFGLNNLKIFSRVNFSLIELPPSFVSKKKKNRNIFCTGIFTGRVSQVKFNLLF